MEHAEGCDCSQCTGEIKVNPIEKFKEISPEFDPECPISIPPVREPKTYVPPKNAKNIAELNDKLEYYVKVLRSEMQQKPEIKEIKQKVKTKVSGLKWIFFVIIVFVFVYAIYLFYMAQTGKHIVLPFVR